MAKTALPQPVAHDLARLVESEELGETLFDTAAHLTCTEEQRRPWQALHALEVQTNAGVRAFIARAGLSVSATNRIARAVGTSGASALRLLPYASRLRLIRHGTNRYLPAFHRLAAYYADTGEAAFFDYVVNHELAIIEFTGNALAAQRNAIDPVLRLLDQEVPGRNRPAG